MAKQDQLFLKGTAKMPDPEGLIAKFVLNSKGVLNSNEAFDPYGRESTHFPEQSENILNTPFKAGDEFVVFSSKTKKAMSNENKEKTHNLDHTGISPTGIGFDASPKKGSLGLAGDGNKTFLFMPMHEKHYNQAGTPEKTIQIMAWKTEGHSAATPSQGGSIVELGLHGASALAKKGLFAPDQEPVHPSGIPNLKEDKLPIDLLNQVNDIKILKGKEKEIKDDIKAKNLEISYRALEKTTGRGSHFGLQELKTHLTNMLNVEEFEGREKAVSLLKAINEHNNKSLALTEKYEYSLLPRSQEVILNSLAGLLADNTTFRTSSPPTAA
jgi:hypothetical protein